jgi:predicted amidohydrolase YtcJ
MSDNIADLVLRNGEIITIDKNNPRSEAVAIKGDRIIAVGSNKDIDRYVDIDVTKIIELEGKLVVPGFIDAHVHFESGGESLMEINLSGVTTLEEIQKRIKEKINEVGEGKWIYGRGWDHEIFLGGKWPTKELIDVVSPKNPVVLTRVDGHSCLVNSSVLKISRITKNTPDPPAGKIVKDPITGEPTGILKESAQKLIKSPQPSEMERYETRKKAIKLAINESARLGVTGIHNLTGDFEIFQELLNNNELKVRVYACASITKDTKTLKTYKEWQKKFENNNHMIKFGYLKVFIDGSLGSGTAAFFEPYTDDPTTTGLTTMSQVELNKLVTLIDKQGFQLGIHAIGSKGNNMVLNAYEEAIKKNGKRDSRHRIEHAQVLIIDDIPRFKEYGVIASMQPTHCITDKRFAEKRIGKDRCKGAYAWKSLLDTGANIAFGTDWPVEPLNPIEGLYAAVTRKDREGESGDGWFPEEKISMEKAIELYTLGSAYASFDENILGSIEKGKLADMVVLSRNLFKIPEDKILETKVIYTIIGGEIIYSSITEE